MKQNIDLQDITSIIMITYRLTHLLQRYVENFRCLFCKNLKWQMRTCSKLIMWIVIMFVSLQHDVNSFSKTTVQYYIVVAFQYLNTLQAIQFVHYTVRQNKYSPQTTNVTFDGNCCRKTNSPRSCFRFILDAYHYIKQIRIV
jgi:hypothetical protein